LLEHKKTGVDPVVELRFFPEAGHLAIAVRVEKAILAIRPDARDGRQFAMSMVESQERVNVNVAHAVAIRHKKKSLA